MRGRVTATEPRAAPLRRQPAALLRWLSCIRLDEVVVLQGAPVIGALFSVGGFDLPRLLALAVLVAGNMCLVGHVFVLNDWGGIATDGQDPRRAGWTFTAKGSNAAEMALLALGLLLAGLLLLGLLSPAAGFIGAGIAVLSGLYSLPAIGGKGIPLFNSALHLVGGALHFLLGYVAFAALSWRAVAISCFFGLVFTAGHFTHETRDHDGDRLNNIRTNAVAFGKRRSFLAGLALFSLAYVLLATLALNGLVPRVLALVACTALPLHLLAARRAFRAGLTFEAVRRLQVFYRRLHAVIGVVMLASVPPW